MDELLQQAGDAVCAFVHAHPEYCTNKRQPRYRGGTNRVTFGYRLKQPVIYKYFVNERRWRHELSCLTHFAPTGLVPQVLEVVPDRIIVMTRLSGSDLNAELARICEDGPLVRQ